MSGMASIYTCTVSSPGTRFQDSTHRPSIHSIPSLRSSSAPIHTPSPAHPTAYLCNPRNHALIRILAAGVSGADNLMRAGGYTSDPRTAHAGFTPGYDLVGVVEAAGEASTDTTIRAGDTVAALSVIGAHATHIVLPVGDLVAIEATDDPVQVTALPLNYMTAYGMLCRSAFPVSAATRCILVGSVAGGVGTAVAQVVRLLFPRVRILGTCSPEKFDMAHALGVVPIDRHVDPAELPAKVRALNDGQGVDIAYEATGSAANLQASLAATKDGVGRVIAIGFMGNIKADGSGMDVQFDPVAFVKEHKERVAWFSVTNGYWRAEKEVFKKDLRDVMVRAVRERMLEPYVGGVYRLEDKVAVDGMLASGRGVRGKLVYAVDEGVWEGRVQSIGHET